MATKPDVYLYSDYRRYLKDYYEGNKAENPVYSYRYLALHAGINSSAFFKFIIEGKRNLTKNTIMKTCSMLKLNELESEYFEALVFYNQAKNLKMKDHFFQVLLQKQRMQKVQKINLDQFEYFEKWYHCVIRELVQFVDFNEDYQMLANSVVPKISISQAKKSVELLIRLGLIEKKGDRYVQSNPTLSAGKGMLSHQINQFQIEMLKKSQEAFEYCEPGSRLMSSSVYGISKSNYQLFVNKIRTLRKQLLDLAGKDTDPEDVYIFNLSLFLASDSSKKPDQ